MRWILLTCLCIGCASNRAPVFDPVPVDQVVTVGGTLDFTLTAIDRDGDSLRYEVFGLPEGARFDPPHFHWVPLASNGEPEGQPHPMIFIAQDELGAVVEAAVTVRVFSGYTRPALVSPTSTVLDLRYVQTLRLPIVVRDDDSEAVHIELIEAPIGAELVPVGAKEALLRWQPTSDQLSQQRVYAVIIRIWDDNPDDFEQVEITVVVHGHL